MFARLTRTEKFGDQLRLGKARLGMLLTPLVKHDYYNYVAPEPAGPILAT
jgi:hypothetical protein